MASEQEFVRFVCEQLRGAGAITSRRMFGEAAIYFQDKVVGLVCDNQLFVKPTQQGRLKLGSPSEAPPFPGAGNWFLMADLDDTEFLADLIRTTADALPARKLKKTKIRSKQKTVNDGRSVKKKARPARRAKSSE